MKLPEIVAAAKALSGTQAWIVKAPNQLSLVAALEVDGVTLASVQLRMRALQDEPDRAVMLQMEYNPPKGRNERLLRIEWKPIGAHANTNKAPEPYRLLIIRTSHIHRFEHNYFAPDDRMLSGNLPHAMPIEPDPSTFVELLDLAAKQFNVMDLKRIATPPWQPRMV